VEEAASGSTDIGTCGTGSMRAGKISTTLGEEANREKSICKFGRSIRRDNISATFGEKLCGQIK